MPRHRPLSSRLLTRLFTLMVCLLGSLAGHPALAQTADSSATATSARPRGQHAGFARTNSAKRSSYSAVIFSSP